MEENNSDSSTLSTIPDSFREPQNPQVWRPDIILERTSEAECDALKLKKKNREIFTVRRKKNYKMSEEWKLKKRDITPIHEEVFSFKRIDFSRKKQYQCRQEKVSSLKAVVSRLQKICLENSELLKDDFTDETIKLLKATHI